MLPQMSFFPSLIAWTAGATVAAAPVTTTDYVLEAVAQEQAIARCTSYVQLQQMVEVDRAGQPKPGQELRVIRRFTGAAPEQRVFIVSANKGGEDVTQQMRDMSVRKSDTQQYRSPFEPSSRPLYMFVRTDSNSDSDPTRPVQLAFRPSYSHRKDKGLFDGVATLDRSTGRLLEWRAQLVNPPTLVTRAQVHVAYGARVGSVDAPSQADVEFEGGFLFIRRQGRMKLEFSDYICPEAMPKETTPAVSSPVPAPPPPDASAVAAERGT
jgi:hypothetical protein